MEPSGRKALVGRGAPLKVDRDYSRLKVIARLYGRNHFDLFMRGDRECQDSNRLRRKTPSFGHNLEY